MTIKVTLINPSDRRFYQAQWEDPLTGLTKTRSTKTTIKRDAERFAGRLEDELNSGTYKPKSNTLWSELQERYTKEVSASKAHKTRLKTLSMFNAVEELLNPKTVRAMADPNAVSKFGAALREPVIIESKNGKTRTLHRAEFTIHGHLAELRKVLRWAAKMELIPKAPYIEFPTTTDGMKGRPISYDEFQSMLKAVPLVKKLLARYYDEWIYFMNGLWLSSLRIEEAMKLHWTDEAKICIDLSGKRPMFRIQAKHEKGRKFRLLPMTPDFAEFLLKTPPSKRKGYVFNPCTRLPGKGQERAHRPTPNYASRIISSIGEAAGVKVNETKFASAHDFRRAFGFRWALLVMPKVLQELMRHESIQTTMEFYVGVCATEAAEAAWRAWEANLAWLAQQSGNTSGNSSAATTQKSAS